MGVCDSCNVVGVDCFGSGLEFLNRFGRVVFCDCSSRLCGSGRSSDGGRLGAGGRGHVRVRNVGRLACTLDGRHGDDSTCDVVRTL